MSGQSIVDRLNAAKHTVSGSALGRAVVKATTEEIMGPKRKHLEYLLQCTSEINVSIPQMADLLIERTQNTSWVVAYKALITIHHLMCYGNERFSQYMASHNSKFILNNFVLTGVQGIDMSSYIRKYAHYLNEKRETYKLMGFDFCKVKRGKDDGMLRTMTFEKLLKTLPILQKQLDALVQFDIQANELTNGVINSCFVLLSKDLIRLFACYNDGIINLLEKFFDMNKKNCKEALEIYKKFLERTESVSLFLKVAESSGMDKSDIPDLAKAPSSLLDALESHVNGVDNKKSTTSIIGAASNGNKSSSVVSSAINSLNNNTTTLLSAEEKRRVLEEEAKTLEAFKSSKILDQNFQNESSHVKKQTSLSSPTNENIFASPNNVPLPNGLLTSNQEDLFGLDLKNINPSLSGTQSSGHSSSTNDDLLILSGANPFIQNIVNQSYSNNSSNSINPFQNNGSLIFQPTFQQTSFPNNNSMFSNSNQNKIDFDAFGDVLQPINKNTMMNYAPNNVNKQLNQNGGDKSDPKVLSTDLDSSLAQLADNLDINYKNKNFQKNHQWNPNIQQGQVKTGGQNWNGKLASNATTPSQPAPIAVNWNPNLVVSPAGTPPGWNANPFATGIIQPTPGNQMAMQQKVNTNQIQPNKPVQSSNPFDMF